MYVLPTTENENTANEIWNKHKGRPSRIAKQDLIPICWMSTYSNKGEEIKTCCHVQGPNESVIQDIYVPIKVGGGLGCTSSVLGDSWGPLPLPGPDKRRDVSQSPGSTGAVFQRPHRPLPNGTLLYLIQPLLHTYLIISSSAVYSI